MDPRIHLKIHRLANLLAVVSICGGICGCDAETPPPPPPSPLTLQLGTVEPAINGDNRWVDLVDDMQVELAPGAQGGFHVWLLYRVGGNNEAQKVTVDRIADRIAQDDSRQRVLTATGVQDLPAEPLFELPAPMPSFMCPTPALVNILDAPVELYVKLSKNEIDGELLCEKRVRLHLNCPPDTDPQHAFCVSICSGK